MRFIPACIAVLAFAVHAAEAPKPIKIELSWRLALDAQGHVTQLNAVGKQPVDRVPQIRTRMEQEIRGWQFTSGKLDGQPAPTQTALHVWATIVPNDNDTVTIHVDKVATGVSIAHTVPPHYPESAVREHRTGQVVLRIGYDATGKVTSVETEPGVPQASNVLVQAAKRAVQAWTFEPELVGGYGRAGYAITPFCYTMTNLTTRQTEGHCDWKRPDTAETVAEGQALALDPAAKLLTDVAGHAL